MPPELLIRPLSLEDDRSRFSCGDAALDDYFHHTAQQQLRKGTAGIVVAVLGDEVVGFATTVLADLETADLPPDLARRLPERVPALRLGRLAVAQHLQRQGVGEKLLRQAQEDALSLKAKHGCVGLLVDAKPTAVAYYERYNFRMLSEPAESSATRPMFLPISAIEGLLSPPPE